MGEGAAFVVLERPEDAAARGRVVLGHLVGHGATSDAHHLVAPPPDGAGAQRAMRLALADAGLAPVDIGHINAHGTSTVLNDAAEAAAIDAVFGAASPPLTAVKGATGHLIGASGALEVIVTLWSLRNGTVPPIAGLRHPDPALRVRTVHGMAERIGGEHALSNAFGFGGANVSLVVRAP
jgi:3-oxoacyl-[acyl-carrier-protein] synthase II